MENVVIEVDALFKRLENFESNFKKCSKQNRTKGYLKGRITGLEELWKNICAADTKIEALKTDDNKNESYFEDNRYGELEEKYYELKGQIEDQLDAFEPQQRVIPIHNQNGNQNNPNGQQRNNQSKVKLPKISLPMFAGSYHTWLSFKNRFTNLIHNSDSLSNVEKLEYLKSCLTPGSEAERTIQRYQITDQNYKAAWDRMNEKYDNKRILQDTQIETIIDRKEMKIETATEIRELLDVIQESLEALNNLEVETKYWDPILVVLVKRKLPFKTREEWEKQLNPVDVPTYAQLIAFLEKRYRTVESLELVGGATLENASKIQTTYNSKAKSNQSSNQRTNCPACDNERHSLMICETFLNMSVNNRSAFVNAKQLCRNCLAIGHIMKDCNSSKRCLKCNRNHHTLLHVDDFNATQEPSYVRKSFFTHGQSYPNYKSSYNLNYNDNHNPTHNPNARNTMYETQQISRAQTQQTHQQLNPSQAQRNPDVNPNYNTNLNPNHNQKNSPHHNTNSNPNRGMFATHDRVQENQLNPSAQNFQPTQTQQPQQPNLSQQNNQTRRNLTTIKETQIMKKQESETLFPTAIIQVKSEGGAIYNLRALLDQCSEEVFIKESVAKMLGRKQFQIPSFDVTGLEGVVTSRVEKSTQVQMVIEGKVLNIEANIVPTLVGMLPSSTVQWPKDLFKNIKLADTNFATPNNVDIMLGTKVYAEILLGGVLKEGGYLAQNTKLGWIISGKCENNHQNNSRSFCGLTRVEKNANKWSGKPRKYYAPQKNSNPVYVLHCNQPTKFTHENEVITHNKMVSPRLSLINVSVNRLRKSEQISKLVNNFEQRRKSSYGIATTSSLMRPLSDMSIFGTKTSIDARPNNKPNN